jgi:hypothetical protein
MIAPDIAQGRLFDPAALDRQRAARMEVTAGGRRERAGRLTA